MKEVLEIRIHGRGGQGAKTASQFIAEAGLDQGKYIKAFPEYGPERRGAPIVAYSRISDKPITTYAPVTNPDVVLVIDDTLLSSVDVTAGLLDTGIIIINSSRKPAEIRDKLNFEGEIYTVDASGIAIKNVGRDLPNIPILGAFVKITNAVSMDSLKNKIKEKFLKKIGKEKTDLTIKTLKEGFENVH